MDANVEAMGDSDDGKKDLFVACFFFVNERRYISVAVMMKERTKNTIRNNLKVTKEEMILIVALFLVKNQQKATFKIQCV